MRVAVNLIKSSDLSVLVAQASQRFGTIPRVTKLHEASGHSHEKGEHDNRYHRPASEATRYLSLGSSHLCTIMIIMALDICAPSVLFK